MIVYNQTYDLYHCIFRILHLLNKFEQGDLLEVDRIRIWDFYLLFPEKIHEISLKQTEKDIRTIRNTYVKRTNNPYENIFDNRKVFEKIRQFQISALTCIASYGIINKEELIFGRVQIVKKDLLKEYISQIDELPPRQQNVISLLTGHFNSISLYGSDGLKSRTDLIESKYDAQ